MNRRKNSDRVEVKIDSVFLNSFWLFMLNLIVLGDQRVQPWSGVVIFDQSKSICGLLLAHLLNLSDLLVAQIPILKIVNIFGLFLTKISKSDSKK